MKVLHVSALNSRTGAGIAAARLHQGLLGRGVDSRFCAAFPTAGIEATFAPRLTLPARIGRMARRSVEAWLVRNYSPEHDYVLSTGSVGHDIGKIVAQECPDILQLHWIGGDSFRLGSLAGVRIPVVWRLSDMWPFCGLEHLEPDREKYARQPQWGIGQGGRFFDISEYFRHKKKAIYRSVRDMTIVSPSRWLASEVKRSALLGHRETIRIPTSCDTNLFLPKDRAACREVLGIPRDKTVVLVGATSMGTRWKGLDLFVDAMIQVGKNLSSESASRLHLVTFGQDVLRATQLTDLMTAEHFGHIQDRRLMSVLYNAANVFVAPSRMENLANTVLESLSCGTPAVAFDIGGMPDMIDHKVNGFLALPFDTASLAEGIQWVIDRRGDEQTAKEARSKVLREFSVEGEIDRYIKLYSSILGEKK